MSNLSNSNLNFILFGHGFALCYLARQLCEKGFNKPVIVTHTKDNHQRDRQLLKEKDLYEYIFDVAEELNLMVLETDVVNKQSVLDFLDQQNCNVGFSVSCRSIIKSPIINFFKGRIYNIHPTLLPEEKGGGTFSWRILNNDDQISATLHLIDEGIDTGNILMQKKERLREAYPKPWDYMTRTNVLYKELIDSFLNQLPLILDSKGETQSNLEGSYLPRLFTELHGAIDWSLDGGFIEKTIRAFSYPYPGAFTFYKEDKIQILESMFSEYSHGMHPLTYGKVISFDPNGHAKVVVRGGFLIVSKVLKKETENNLPSKLFSHPVHFHTPNEYLERALSKSIKISETKKFE